MAAQHARGELRVEAGDLANADGSLGERPTRNTGLSGTRDIRDSQAYLTLILRLGDGERRMLPPESNPAEPSESDAEQEQTRRFRDRRQRKANSVGIVVGAISQIIAWS